jgi:hypothetical protein
MFITVANSDGLHVRILDHFLEKEDHGNYIIMLFDCESFPIVDSR